MRTTARTLLEPVAFGPYVLTELLGRGGMAEVLRARRFGAAGFERDVAIKRILQHFADDETFVTMFVDEARLMASLNHPNTVTVHDLGVLDDFYFMVMEYIAVKDFLAVLARTAKSRRRVPPDIALHVVTSILDGLAYVHGATDRQGQPLRIVHRDVSPSNVFLSYGGVVKLGDFGIARSAQQRHLTSGGQKGKLGYMSPEQVRGQAVDARSDLFSAAVILFESLTMSRLFRGENEQIVEDIAHARVEDAFERRSAYLDGEIVSLLRRALAVDPDARFPDAESFRSALTQYARKREYALDPSRLRTFLSDIFRADIEEDQEIRKREDARLSALGATPEPTWYLRDGEGRTQGPMAMHQLQLAVTETLATDSLEVREATGPWRAAASEPRIRSALAARSPQRSITAEQPVFAPASPSGPGGKRHATSTGILRRISSPARQTDGHVLEATPPPAAPAAGEPRPAAASEAAAPRGAAAKLHPPFDTEDWERAPTPRPESSPGEPEDHPKAHTPSASGDFSSSSYLRLLHHVSSRSLTGSLRLAFPDHEREIFFVDGRAVQATTAHEEERLGQLLLQEGLLDPQALEDNLNAAASAGTPIGHWLLSAGVVSPHVLFGLVQRQLELKLLDAAGRSGGTWEWLPGRRTSVREVEVAMALIPLLFKALRLRCPASWIQQFLRPWWQRPLIAPGQPTPLDQLPLDGAQTRLARRLRPGRTIQDTLDALSEDPDPCAPDEVLRMLLLLVETNVLALPGRTRLELQPGD